MDKSGLQPFYPRPLDVIMEEYHPHSGNQSGFVSENFNVEIHGNCVDTHYHHGALTSGVHGGYRGGSFDPLVTDSYHYSKNILDKSYKVNRFEAPSLNNIEFYSKGPGNIETDFRAHVDYNNQIVVANDQERTSMSPEGFKELMDETRKEIEAAATAVDNLGYNYSQDVKTVFHDLSKRLDDSHARWLNDVTDNNVALKDELINNLTDMLTKEKERAETERKLGERTVEELEHKQEEFNTKLADKFYARKVKQNVINTLRAHAMKGWKQRCEEESQKRTEDVCRQLNGKYNAAQEKLEEEIAKLKREQAKLAQEKADYEAAIQQGLMKGLCSLNMEALKVFKLKLTPSGTDVTWQTPSEESNRIDFDRSQPHITGADSDNPVGLTPSLVVIMENSKDRDTLLGSSPSRTTSDADLFVNRSAGQPRPSTTPKKKENESTEVTTKKSKHIKLPPNYQVLKLMKKSNTATSTKKK